MIEIYMLMVETKQMAHLDYRLEKSRWEAEQLRSAPLMPSEPVEEEDNEEDPVAASSSNQMRQPGLERFLQRQQEQDWEAEAQLLQEEKELEAMIAMMEGQEMDQRVGGPTDLDAHEMSGEKKQETTQTPYASDDDEYDEIFMDLIDHSAGEEALVGLRQVESGEGVGMEGDEMDMS